MVLMAAYLVIESHSPMRTAVMLYPAVTVSSLDRIVSQAALSAASVKSRVRMDQGLVVI